MENLALKYQQMLYTSSDPASILTEFFKEVFHLRTATLNLRITINRLIGLYGRNLVFNAILSISNMRFSEESDVYGILNYHCRKELLDTKNTGSMDLSEEIKRKEEEMGKIKNSKLNIPTPFGEQSNE